LEELRYQVRKPVRIAAMLPKLNDSSQTINVIYHFLHLIRLINIDDIFEAFDGCAGYIIDD